MLIGLERDLLRQHNVADGKAPLRPEAPDGDLHIVLVEFVNVHLTTVADAIVLPAVAAGHIEVPRALVTLMIEDIEKRFVHRTIPASPFL
jgi:hypothetical protein